MFVITESRGQSFPVLHRNESHAVFHDVPSWNIWQRSILRNASPLRWRYTAECTVLTGFPDCLTVYLVHRNRFWTRMKSRSSNVLPKWFLIGYIPPSVNLISAIAHCISCPKIYNLGFFCPVQWVLQSDYFRYLQFTCDLFWRIAFITFHCYWPSDCVHS